MPKNNLEIEITENSLYRLVFESIDYEYLPKRMGFSVEIQWFLS
jgi:hypothetical protein